MFVVALALLIVGVWAVGETQHINLSGNVDFTISDNNLYIKDIRFRDAGSSEQGTTIDNFIPGFVKSSFELNLGSFDVDSDFDLIIDVVNTTTTIYEVDTSFDISNGTVIASGRIEGDGVPLTEVSTADISGQIILSVTITSAGTVSIDQVDVPLTEYIPLVYDYFTFEPNSDGKTVTLTAFDQSKADTTDIVIPATVSQNSSGEWIEGNTYTVTAITDGGSTSGVFYNSGITSVTFPSSLTSIGEWAFYRCSGLTGELNLGECTSLTSIGDWAFRDCSGLTSISLPSSLTSIGNYAFYECSGLTSVDLNGCTSLTSVGGYAFYKCSGLTGELDLSNCTSLTSIGYMAFYYCSGLTSISLPSSLTSIRDYAFNGCSGLTGELNLGECTSLTSIGSSAFSYCDGLTGTVTIPASVTEIGDNPFADCNLEGIVVEEGNSEYYLEGNCLIEKSTKTLITGFNNSTIPSDIKIIGDNAFYECSGLTSVDLSGCTSLTRIGDSAFQSCSGLTGELNLGGCTSLTSIGEFAFDDCSGLTGELNLGECTSLTSIGRSAFEYCSGLTSITLPSSLKAIGNSAFQSCSGLTGELNLGGCASLTSIGGWAFQYCSGLTSVDLSGCTNLTSIGNNAFSGCSGLTSVDLSGCTSLTSIESFAFYNCSALVSVVFPEGSTGWEVSTSSSMTNPISVDVTNASTNASNLTDTYYNYYWKRG